MHSTVAFLPSLAQIAPVLTEAHDVAPFVTDWQGTYSGKAIAVVQPRTTEEVASIVRLCGQNNISIVPQGGNTGLAVAATPLELENAIVLSFSKLNRIREVDSIGNTITVEAGCVLTAIQEAAQKTNRFFPLSLSAEGTAQIGGLISTNAGGTGVLRYGTMRALVLGLEVVLPDGSIANGLRALRKDNAGYDWKQLFIGAEGTLGCVTAAVLRLFQRPREVATAVLGISNPQQALNAFTTLQELLGDTLTACELFPDLSVQLRTAQHKRDHAGESQLFFPMQSQPWYLLVEFSGSLPHVREAVERALEELIEKELAEDCIVAESSAQAAAVWEWRHSISETEKREGPNAKHDVSVPISTIPQFLTEATTAVESTFPGSRVLAFGHIGDGNIHFNVLLPTENTPTAVDVNHLVHTIVAQYNGSITAEHGIGRYRRDELQAYRSGSELDIMHAVKRAVDPTGIMNPGAVLP